MSILKKLPMVEVAVERPVRDDSLAHRPTYGFVQVKSRTHEAKQMGAARPRCKPNADPCAEFSAGWANHIGLQPCMRPECFGGGDAA